MTDIEKEHLTQFKKANKPKAPVYMHLSEIYDLGDSGYTHEDIMFYLNETYKISTSSRTLTRIFSIRKNSEVVESFSEIQPTPNAEKSKASAFFNKE